MIPCITFSLFAALLLVSCDKQQGSRNQSSGLSNDLTNTRSPHLQTKSYGDKDADANTRETLSSKRKPTSPEDHEKVVTDIIWHAKNLDPAYTREILHELKPDSAEKNRLIQHAAMRLAEENPDEALKWADTLGTEKETAAAKCQIAMVLAEKNPQRAANILSDSGIEGRELDIAVVQVIQRWAAHSPPEAAAWVATFPEGNVREAGVKAVISRWLITDTKAVFSWQAQLTDPALAEDVIAAMAELSTEQPEPSANAWLQQTDAKTRAAIVAKRKSPPEPY